MEELGLGVIGSWLLTHGYLLLLSVRDDLVFIVKDVEFCEIIAKHATRSQLVRGGKNTCHYWPY